MVATHSWIIAAGAIPLFQGVAAWSPRSVEEVIVEVDFDGRAAGMLSYLPVTAAVGVLAAMLTWAPQHVTRGTYAIFLGMVILLLLRQFQAIQDLQAARETLADRVKHRTHALEQAQEAILRTERMNTLAMMGAGLAHDLNNLLSAVKGSADLALINLESGIIPRPEDLERITMAADRAALMTRKLMDFARREKEDLHPMDLGREVREMETTLRLLLPRSVAFSLRFGGSAPFMVMGTRVQLEQMLVNLVANAADAMPSGGTLSVRVDRAGTHQDLALIEVVDSGIGMTPEVLARIFDAFYTTKAPGKGTGLGLSSLKAMVEEVGGRLEVESEPDRGSCFRILVPLCSPEVSPR
jgi:signal transduction histidine kinase